MDRSLSDFMAGAREAYDRDPRSEFQLSFVTDADPGDENEEEEN